MELPSFLRRNVAAPTRGASDGDAATARSRARRRLIGAVVLLGIGIVAFPLLFETAPRPIPVDIPIEIPSREAAAPASAAPPPAATRAPQTSAAATGATTPTPAATEAPASSPTPAPPPTPTPTAKAPAAAPAAAVASAADAAAAPPARANDGARAKALLEGKPAAAADSTRYVVQIGAFAEDKTIRDARAKAEAAGLKTYTQVVKVDAGERTRVRVGPFDSRDSADDAAARLKKAGLPATVLKL